MHYLFFDESYPSGDGQKRIVMAAWVVEQACLNRCVDRLPDLFKPPVLERIESMLKLLDGWAVVASATIEPELFRTGEIDSTGDIPGMARTDNIWSQCAFFLTGSLIKELFHAGQEVGTIDIHFDPKSLKSSHADAIKKTLRGLMVAEARRYAFERGLSRLRKLKIRRVQSVSKPSSGQTFNKFQMGTWVADKLCSKAGHIKATGLPSRIMSLNMSDVVRRTVQQFDGKSFYED
jgi:hypothetical protein